MPRFFFHIRYKTLSFDDEGIELADREAAWTQATKATGQMLRDLDGDLEPGRTWRMDITDDTHRILFSLKFMAESYSD